MTKLDEKKVLVTGGAEFIGSEVVRQLCEQKADVTVLDNFFLRENGIHPKIRQRESC